MKYILPIILFSLGASLSAQTCHEAPIAFGQLGKDDQFVAVHAEPIDLPANGKGRRISFPTAGEREGFAYFLPAEEPSNKVLIVVHEWWGLNAQIQQTAEQYAELLPDVSVYAIDLYDGKSTSSREEASKLMEGANPERCEAIIHGLLEKIGPDAQIATIGWCFGGGWSLQTALLAKKQIKSCVMYYGMPEKEASRLEGFPAPIMFVHAKKDQWINDEIVNTFKSLAKSVSLDLTVLEYEADHAFANPSNPQYQPEFTADAQEKALRFIRQNFN